MIKHIQIMVTFVHNTCGVLHLQHVNFFATIVV